MGLTNHKAENSLVRYYYLTRYADRLLILHITSLSHGCRVFNVRTLVSSGLVYFRLRQDQEIIE